MNTHRLKEHYCDLAVAGGVPAFAETLHVGRPNIGDRDAFMNRVGQIFDRRWLTNNGPLVQELERRLSDFLGVKHCVMMCNGTIALEIAIRALGLSGEVIVPSYTFIATAHALQWQRITPVFAEIDPSTHNIDPVSVECLITPETTGIIGVHLWGRPAAVEALREIAERHRISLLFDASHALGCSHAGRMIGHFGRAEVFSFHATKFFNTFEGGAVATNDDDLAAKMRLMKNFGFAGYDRVVYPGTNGKMSEISAAMGLTGLDSLDKFVEINKANYQAYQAAIHPAPGLSLLSYPENEKCNYQYIIIEIGEESVLSRDEWIRILHAENILARKYFWPGCHRMEPYRSEPRYAELHLPVTDLVAARVIVMPTGAAVTTRDIEAMGRIFRLGVEHAAKLHSLLAGGKEAGTV